MKPQNKTLKKLPGIYCSSLTTYKRFVTREVSVGEIPLGAHHPIRLQSMTTIDTMDTKGSIEQSIRMIEAGSEYVRITAPSLKEAENLRNIKAGIRAAGFNTPLIADIHFTPNAAELAARVVEKVRVNPGNYADKKKFDVIEYNDAAYQAELDRIRKRFEPLVKICKEEGTAMRIGTNHGSLSDRIMSRYGDTPLGMVESAMEFIRICEDLNYHQLVLSMKASNPQTMVQAYRLLVKTMIEEGMNYPLHLGVTEAGDGEDGRIKSAVGIGALLEDGLGDTVRVSLTEEPEAELPVARGLVENYASKSSDSGEQEHIQLSYNPFSYERRKTHQVLNIGGENVPRVFVSSSASQIKTPSDLAAIGYQYDEKNDKYRIADISADYLYLNDALPNFSLPGSLAVLMDEKQFNESKERLNTYPIYSLESAKAIENNSLKFVSISKENLDADDLSFLKKTQENLVLILRNNQIQSLHFHRKLIAQLAEAGIQSPTILHGTYGKLSDEQLLIQSACHLGNFLVDGMGEGLWIESASSDLKKPVELAFGILQSTRTRISRTEYISCPSCGRTLFDLQETTQKIRSRTDHLKGVKIGIMGCIVNGPGEMADADYGYVGTGPGKITLFKGKEVVKRNIATEKAVDALIDLIKDHGDWKEPELIEND